jgi:hypothetical protein
MGKLKAIVHIAHIRGKGKSVGQNARAFVGQMGNVDIPFLVATIVTLYIPIFNSLN